MEMAFGMHQIVLVQKVPKVDVKSTGKQQEAKRPVHQSFIEIYLPKNVRNSPTDLKGGLDQIKTDN